MTDQKSFELSPSAAILMAGVVIAAAIVFARVSPAAEVVVDGAAQGTALKVTKPSQDEHIIGRADARIVLIEYSDFQCPYCATIHPTLKRIVEESNGDVAWTMRSLPLTSIHPEAEPAANAAECVASELGNDAFWKFAEVLFANQKELSSTFYINTAIQLGANPLTFSACISERRYQNVVDRESLEAQKLGATGTPFVVVLNTKTGVSATIPGALPYAQAMAVIKSVQ